MQQINQRRAEMSFSKTQFYLDWIYKVEIKCLLDFIVPYIIKLSINID